MGPIGIILLEGADSSGKTTLARVLVERYDAMYLHSIVRRDIWRWHVGALRRACRESARRLVVMDRLHLSELVYGRVYRGGPAYDVGARSIDRILRRFAALTVLCVPSDLREQEARWARDRAAGKREHFDSVRQVIQLYADLRWGNIASAGPSYLGQLTGFQDFATRDDVKTYDMDAHSTRGSVRRFAQDCIVGLESLRRRSYRRGLDWEHHNLAGRANANRHRSALIVGEQAGTRPNALPRWPLVDDDRVMSAATWLNRAVHIAALREDRLVFTNARLSDGTEDPSLNELLFENDFSRIVALGNVARERLARLGVDHKHVVHPQAHRRFKHSEGPEGYARMLGEALA